MTLFSLLLVMLAERLKLWQQTFQFESFSRRYFALVGVDRGRPSIILLVAALLPALVVGTATERLSGWWFGVPNLIVWLVIGLLLFGHSSIRQRFRQFLHFASSDDIDACHQLVQQMDACHRKDADEYSLGQHMGELAAWINFRYYAAVALYFVVLGPAFAMFYSLVRDLHDHHSRLGRPRLSTTLHLLDWLPARIVSVSFAFAGHFQQSMQVLLPNLINLRVPARKVVVDVAIAAEEMPSQTKQPICILSTLAMLKLVKRNLVLLLVVVSFLTIFGFLQ
ncbi:beta-lactamase regulator AmpE [Ferrimonas lipolytica]|uniref:Beta-lactamase regulator AmpE n=1 Tax=Ferrimonas lipolytica TaxID=2724191 RepID=A0A6H1UHN1_9GAMM|nr:beta-lactamase regulator AmpE [Ferrimonas lipolytica]QIZ78554.1 beta-lactamase regulator AmpE [Ferrimonas lipolytica]